MSTCYSSYKNWKIFKKKIHIMYSFLKVNIDKPIIIICSNTQKSILIEIELLRAGCKDQFQVYQSQYKDLLNFMSKI